MMDELAAVIVTRMKSALTPVYDRLQQHEQAALREKAETELLITRELTPLRERLAAVEARPPVPGPPGANGQDGKDGKDGEPGPPGAPGGQWKEWSLGTAFLVGDQTTWAGGLWLCKRATTGDRPGTSDAWKLIVKSREAK